MLLPWKDERCVVCLQPQDRGLTNAHVIPQAVGGKLAVKNICADCNSRLGATAEAGLKSDPRIRVAIEDLQAQIPALAATMRAGQEFIARDEDVVIRATSHGEAFRILDSPQEAAHGSRIPSGPGTRSSRRSVGSSAPTTSRWPPSELFTMHLTRENLSNSPPGLAIKKGSVDNFTLPFSEPLVEDKCFLAIGYLFLSLLIQGVIYDSALQPIRGALLREVDPDGSWSVESYLVRSRPHEPWHGLGVEQSEPYFVIQVRLFGQHAWRVNLSRIGCRQALLPARTYRLDLASGEEVFVA